MLSPFFCVFFSFDCIKWTWLCKSCLFTKKVQFWLPPEISSFYIILCKPFVWSSQPDLQAVPAKLKATTPDPHGSESLGAPSVVHRWRRTALCLCEPSQLAGQSRVWHACRSRCNLPMLSSEPMSQPPWSKAVLGQPAWLTFGLLRNHHSCATAFPGV